MKFTIEIEYDEGPGEDVSQVLFALCDNAMDNLGVQAVTGRGEGARCKLPEDNGPHEPILVAFGD